MSSGCHTSSGFNVTAATVIGPAVGDSRAMVAVVVAALVVLELDTVNRLVVASAATLLPLQCLHVFRHLSCINVLYAVLEQYPPIAQFLQLSDASWHDVVDVAVVDVVVVRKGDLGAALHSSVQPPFAAEKALPSKKALVCHAVPVRQEPRSWSNTAAL